ncbi:hypothetical protein [Listeria monocytogenes]|uniref:hypothetical protein n=1 Tax=Listeria monocytogenes TaxID=1639 RepID=UPI000A1F5B68|nr:hypothetical protein [Listeria monocytogenes]
MKKLVDSSPNIASLQLMGIGVDDMFLFKNDDVFSRLEKIIIISNSINNIDFLMNPSGFPNLKILNLSSNILDFSDLNRLADVLVTSPKVGQINIECNIISDVTLITQISLPNLNMLSIGRNHISDVSCLSNLESNQLLNITAQDQTVLLPDINSVPTNKSFLIKLTDIIDIAGVKREPTIITPGTGSYEASVSKITWPMKTWEKTRYGSDNLAIPKIQAHDGVTYKWKVLGTAKLYIFTTNIICGEFQNLCRKGRGNRGTIFARYSCY